MHFQRNAIWASIYRHLAPVEFPDFIFELKKSSFFKHGEINFTMDKNILF